MGNVYIRRHINHSGEPPVSIVSWQNGTDAEIKAMIDAADAGKINLGDYWSLGDKRTISHSAMPAKNVGETHAAQSKSWVLMDTGAQSGYVFSDNTPVHYVVGMEDCFDETGYMNSTAINTGSWESSARRKWCNNELRNSFDSDTRALFKQFKTITASNYNKDTLTISLDYFSVFAEKEIFGAATYSRTSEANALTQIRWYYTSANRKKELSYWLRSPNKDHVELFTKVHNKGTIYIGNNANSKNGISVFGCI